MKNEKVTIKTEYIKLDSLLKFAGAAPTGGMAKEIIESGAVSCNGEQELRRGRKIRPGDKVIVDGLIEIEVE